MAMTASVCIFALLSAANIALAAECSEGCFRPDGRLDPNAVADPQLFRYRAAHSCMTVTMGVRSEWLTVRKLLYWANISTSTAVY
jgi:hypothetical protein